MFCVLELHLAQSDIPKPYRISTYSGWELEIKVSLVFPQGTHCTGKTGKMAKNKSLAGKTQGIWKFCKNTGNLVCSSCKFSK